MVTLGTIYSIAQCVLYGNNENFSLYIAKVFQKAACFYIYASLGI